MKKYVSPKVEFNTLNLKENIAATCWGYQANGKSPTFYYDVAGEGYVSFTLGKTGSCDSPDAINILYYKYKGEDGVSGSQYESEVEKALASKGGNAGQNYDGITIDFPIAPDPGWS